MILKVFKLLKIMMLLLAASLATFLAVRAYDAFSGAPLQPWHLHVPKELSTKELAKADWEMYLARENAILEELRIEVTQKLGPDERIPSNRYFADSPVYPGNFATDWNRSYLLEPEGDPVGAVVLLHGLTDSPYSLRHIAQRYKEHGYVAVAIRLPGHGTVPAGLTQVYWENWSEATRLAVREARRRTRPESPLHLVGFSNGGALAMKYVLDATAIGSGFDNLNTPDITLPWHENQKTTHTLSGSSIPRHSSWQCPPGYFFR